MIFNLNFIWNSMCKGNSCFNIFQNLTGGSIFCPKTQTPSLWGWENAEFEKVSFAKSAKAFDLTLHSHWLTPTTLVEREWKRQKIVLFKVNFLYDFSHNDFCVFCQYHSVCQRKPSGWETLKMAIGFVGRTNNIYIALLHQEHFKTPSAATFASHTIPEAIESMLLQPSSDQKDFSTSNKTIVYFH